MPGGRAVGAGRGPHRLRQRLQAPDHPHPDWAAHRRGPAGSGDRVLPLGPGEKGIRSERALKLAVAEMDVQGVSTRKVAAVTEQLCGLEVTSGQVSRAAQALDAEP